MKTYGNKVTAGKAFPHFHVLEVKRKIFLSTCANVNDLHGVCPC